jgi:transposase
LVGTGRKGTGTTTLVLMDGKQTPLGVVITAADAHEVQHVERLVESAVVDLPSETRLIYDKAADSDPLRDRLAARGIELICPHRENRTKPKRQDGRKLRRRRHRWKVERTNGWLHNYGRFSVRKDRLAVMFLGWAQLACLFTILKRF